MDSLLHPTVCGHREPGAIRGSGCCTGSVPSSRGHWGHTHASFSLQQALTDLLHPETGRGSWAGSCPVGDTLPDTLTPAPQTPSPSFVYP